LLCTLLALEDDGIRVRALAYLRVLFFRAFNFNLFFIIFNWHFVKSISKVTNEKQSLYQAIHIAGRSFINQSFELVPIDFVVYKVFDFDLEYQLIGR